MRFQRSLVLLGTALLFWAIGPWVVVAAIGALFVPRVRSWLRPPWRVVVAGVGVVAVLVGITVLIPDGWLPIPPGPGALVTPSYVGRPVVAQPIEMKLPQHPGLATNGSSSMHNDAWASDAYAGPGPLGESPEVDTGWYGLEECATLAFDSHQRLIALCGDLKGPTLHVIDPDSMRPLVSKDLPDRSEGPDANGKEPRENLCAGASFFLDDADRAVVATTDRRILIIATDDADGDPDLTTRTSFDLSDRMPQDDCLIALMPDWRGRIWWVTQAGRVGTVDPDSPSQAGAATVLNLDEEIANSLATSQDGGVYVITTEALYKLGLDRVDKPKVTWRATYDRGSETKPGQPSQGSGTTPTLMPGGVVAITDNADPRMNVVFYRMDDGTEICRMPVFEDGASATGNSLVSVGTGVVVENNYGYSGPGRTLLGRTTAGGLARVDLDDGECSLAWTSEVIAPTSVAKVSLANGLLYVYSKPKSWWGVNAWYFTAIDARTGRLAWAVRAGLGTLFDNHYAAVTLAPDGSAYIATLAGLVRVRDRSR